MARSARRSPLRGVGLGGPRSQVAVETEGAVATEWVGLVGGPQECYLAAPFCASAPASGKGRWGDWLASLLGL